MAAISAVVGLVACNPQATTDVGDTWISAVPHVFSMQWTSDSQTLLYSVFEGELNAIHLGSRSPRKLGVGVYSPHLVSAGGEETIFFQRVVEGSRDEVNGSPAQLEWAQAPLLGDTLGTPHLVSTAQTYGETVISAQGERLALPVGGRTLVVDVGTGDSRMVTMNMPVAFAPNASSLFGSNGLDYVVIDESGKVTPVIEASSDQVRAVTRWEADLPREVVIGNSNLLDLATGETRPLLPGIETNGRSFAGVSGDALRPKAAYVWQEECLHRTHVGQPPIEVCAEPQTTLHRIDLENRTTLAVASMPEMRLLAVSPDGLELATFYDDEFTFVDRIDLKKLPPF